MGSSIEFIEFDIEGVAYEAIPFLFEGEKAISSTELTKRAENFSAIAIDWATWPEWLFIKRHKNNLPEELRRFILVGRSYPQGCEYGPPRIEILQWNPYAPEPHWFGDSYGMDFSGWDQKFRFLRRKPSKTKKVREVFDL